MLFVAHALVGTVELGTDSWIQNITGNFLTENQGKILFVFASAIMFSLRFCADFIERRIGLSPVGILFTCAVLACIGLNLASGIETFVGALVAFAVYAVGKTFFWPTMLAVGSDRFPRTGAIAISMMGGIGMMAAGLVGVPGLGYAKDRFAGEALRAADPAVYEEYAADTPSEILVFGESGEQHVREGAWNTYRIVAEGDRVRTWINGQPCVDLRDPAGAREGVIGLQVHSGGPTEVRFRNLELTVMARE